MALDNTIEYNGDTYIMMVKLIRTVLSPAFDKVTEEETVNLPMDNINQFEILTDITNPLMTATIDVTDGEESYLNGFTGSACNYALIGIKKVDQSNQATASGVQIFDWTFTHLFIIDDISITGKKEDTINYKMNLTSSYFWNFNNRKPLSTNAGESQSISNIISNLFNNVGIPLGTKINTVTSDVDSDRHYISAYGQSMMDSYKYLLRYINTGTNLVDNGLSMMVYDHMADNYDIWTSASNKDGISSTAPMTDSIRLNVNQNFLDTLVNQNQPKILLANYEKQSNIIENLYSNKDIKYDYASNTFSSLDTTTKQLIDGAMSSGDVGYQSKFKELDQYISQVVDTQQENYTTASAQWNENDTHYQAVLSALTSNNILTINMGGKFDRLVGDPVYIGVDINSDAMSSLQYLIGWWTCLRVRHIFTSNSYTSNVVVGRFTELTDVDKLKDVV